MVQLQRQIFEIPRAAEYFSIKELQAQTGQSADYFATVVLKELVDNSLDACENAGVTPEITIEISGISTICISVLDNGPGIAPETISSILNFSTRTTDKGPYISPTRGTQGNAWKTILGIPPALGGEAPVIIESKNVRHIIRAWTDAADNLMIEHHQEDCNCQGTQVTVILPAEDQDLNL